MFGRCRDVGVHLLPIGLLLLPTAALAGFVANSHTLASTKLTAIYRRDPQ